MTNAENDLHSKGKAKHARRLAKDVTNPDTSVRLKQIAENQEKKVNPKNFDPENDPLLTV